MLLRHRIMLAEQVINMSPKRKNGPIAISVATMIALAVLVFFVATGSLAPRSFGIDCAIVIIISTFTWILLLKRPHGDLEALNKGNSALVKSRNRSKSVQVALLLLLLFVSFWFTRGGPWVPRLIDASMLLLFLIGTILRNPK
jgi:hypothetical protein